MRASPRLFSGGSKIRAVLLTAAKQLLQNPLRETVS
jgi:hypothetical protein